tara:strand:- start:219 stop:470 length:252 start_codon:yes stop_codon:yes gene_type:complete
MATKEALVKLRDLMQDSGKSVEDLFKEIDTDGDGTINGPELYKGIKNLVGDALSPSQISLIITALDTNGDNRIDALELRNALS